MDFDVLIEIPAGSHIKYEIDEETGDLRVDRFLHTSSVYPYNYGFIRNTQGEDNDPLDIMIVASERLHPGVAIKCHAVGYLEMEDEAGVDTKIIGVPDKKIDPVYGAYDSIDDVPEATRSLIKQFFQNYKSLEPGKWVKVKGFRGAAEAKKQIEKASEFKK
jgi:inorganic pyrophosphatase